MALPSELDDRIDTLGEDLDVERLVSHVCYEEIVQAALAAMDNEMHREVCGSPSGRTSSPRT